MPLNTVAFSFGHPLCESTHEACALRAFPFATASQVADLGFQRMMLWAACEAHSESLRKEEEINANKLYADLVKEEPRFYAAAQKVANFFGCSIEHAGETFLPEGNLI